MIPSTSGNIVEDRPLIPDFTLIRKIGSGSYGDVWLGRSVTGIYRAVKFVDRARFQDSRPFLREFDGIRRFQKAVGTQQQQLALLHVGCDEQAGVLYYVMELADDAAAGTNIDPERYAPATLKELRRRRAEPFPASECIEIGVFLASALAGLHDAGLIHRDVKPSNIIFVGGIPKLADVGLVASSAQTLTSLGTPGYAPPEGGGSIQADLYSLGKILYELVTGLGPEEFPRVPLSLMSKEAAPQLLELNEVILRACDPVPASRYPKAQAFLEELRLLQAGRSVQELNRNRRRLRRLTRWATVGALLSLGALAILGTKNYFSLRKLAAKEAAFRQLAEADDRAARYTSDLHLARLGLAARDFGATRIALRRQIPRPGAPDLRGFEWYALWNETRGDSISQGGAVGDAAITALTLSSDERFLAVQEGEQARDTAIWDLKNLRRTLVARQTRGLGRFSEDSSRLLVGMEDKGVGEIELPTQTPRPQQGVAGRLRQALPDGRTLLLSEPGPMDSKLIIWDAAAQQLVAEWRPQLREYKISLSAAALTLDRRLLAASFFGAQGAARTRDLVVHDLSTHADRFHLDDVASVQWLRFSPDGKWLAIAMYNQLTRIVSTDTGKTIRQLAGQNSLVNVVEFSPDSQMLASAGADQAVYVWDVESGNCLQTFHGHEAEILSLSWFADNHRLITGSRDGTWRIWSLSSKPVERSVEKLWADVLGDFVFTPDGQRVAVTDNQGRTAIYDTSTLEEGEILADAFQPLLYDDKRNLLYALSKQNTLISYNLARGTAQPLGLELKTKQKLVVVEPSIRHQQVAFGFDGGDLEVWDLARLSSTGPITLQSIQISALGWAPDKLELAGGDRGGRVTGKTVSPEPYKSQWAAQDAAIASLGYTNDGALLAIGRTDGKIVLENRKDGKVLDLLQGHSASVTALAFSPDGSRLVTGSNDGMIIFWSIELRRPIAVWSCEDNLRSTFRKGIFRLKFDSAGTRLGAMTEDGRLRIWDATR